ncbi:MAG: hypothetical protein Kow00124_28300 [Anaerolineae bacterium]
MPPEVIRGGGTRYNQSMSNPLIVITGTPAWADEAARVLDAAGFAVVHYRSRAGYVARLADDHAALVLVDGADPAWPFWATTPKASPATRRIPVIVITANATQHDEALTAGADLVLPSEHIPADLPALARQHARIQDDTARAEILDQCAEPLPPEAREAVALFNAGEYYRQHDALEALWMAETGPVRDLYRAILQVGVAYYQVERGNQRGALKMLLRSLQWLNMLPDVCRGVDVRQLREDALRVRDALQALPPDDDLSAFDRSLLKPVRLVG